MNPLPSQNSRVIKVKTPVFLIVAVVIGCFLLFGGVYYALNTFQTGFEDARMTGVIKAKQFTEAPQEEISIGKGGLQKREISGEFTLTVAVRSKDGDIRDYTVWVSEKLYNQLKVGEDFDVGPYLVPGGK